MTADELRKIYIDFFVAKGHKEIAPASLVPENDPTVLFTTAGMHPLVPYLMGESHPQGKRLVNIQKCLRTDDIDEVGDPTHNTFFEMLGNWSLGDYWKEEAITWSFEFLTKELNIPVGKLAVTIFEGDDDAPCDEDSAAIWRKLGIVEDRIFPHGKKDNWWGPVGNTGPCGPDTEMFVWVGSNSPHGVAGEEPLWVEVWNDVFMEYSRAPDGEYEPLKQRNVDTGMGLERVLAVLNNKDNVYETDVFASIIEAIRKIGKYETQDERVIADHLRASIMLVANGVEPANKLQGYILRRLLRRAIVKLQPGNQEIEWESFTRDIVSAVSKIYELDGQEKIREMVLAEIDKFHKTLNRGMREVQKIETIDGKIAFDLYQTYGFPLEVTEELFREKGQEINHTQFEAEFEKHKELSRTASAGMFKGGLADHSDETIRGHTATHLLHQALRDVLGDSVHQTGSNITPERIRFDFAFGRKLTDSELRNVEGIINQKIQEDLPVRFEMMTLKEAKKTGAIGLFDEKYSDNVKVYFVGGYSAEFCGGPHVEHTAQVGNVKITKETAAGAGSRRIYMELQ